MKKLMMVLGAVCTSLLFTACTTVNSSDGGSMNILPTTVGPVDDYRPLYTVNEKVRVSGESSVTVLFWIFAWGDSNSFADNASIFEKNSLFGRVFAIFPNAKNIAAKAAFYRACKTGKCDTVVAARYDIVTDNYLFIKKMSVKVSGFPAAVTSVETVKPMPYYVDANGKIVVLDKFVKPHCLMNYYAPQSKSLLEVFCTTQISR